MLFYVHYGVLALVSHLEKWASDQWYKRVPCYPYSYVHFVPKCACMITNHGSLRLFWKCAYQGIKIISVFQPPKRLDSRYKVVSKLEVFLCAVLEVQVTVSHLKPHCRIPVACCHLEHWDCAIWEHVQLYVCVVDTVARPWQHCVGNQWHFRMHYD